MEAGIMYNYSIKISIQLYERNLRIAESLMHV